MSFRAPTQDLSIIIGRGADNEIASPCGTRNDELRRRHCEGFYAGTRPWQSPTNFNLILKQQDLQLSRIGSPFQGGARGGNKKTRSLCRERA
jgi:hypothetical protein